MTDVEFKFVKLAELDIPKASFTSSSEALNQYFYRQASQDVKRNISNCFVLIDNSANAIVGYYTLAAASLLLDNLPEATQKKLPRYPTIPVVRIGRLALDKKFVGKGIGRYLLVDAIMRTVQSDIAAYAVIVDAKDENAVEFYQKYGFIASMDNPKLLYCPLSNWKK